MKAAVNSSTEATKMKPRNVFFAPGQWEGVMVAAAHLTIKEGRNITASEFVRRAVDEKIAKESEKT